MKSNLALVTSATCGGQGIQFIHVCDRGAVNFDVFAHLLLKGDSWGIRAAQLKRKLCTAAFHRVLYTHESVASFQDCIRDRTLRTRTFDTTGSLSLINVAFTAPLNAVGVTSGV